MVNLWIILLLSSENICIQFWEIKRKKLPFVYIVILHNLLFEWIYNQCIPVILQHIEEESKTNKYLVKIQQVKELEEKNKILEDMQRVVSEPLLGQTEISELENKVRIIFLLIFFSLYLWIIQQFMTLWMFGGNFLFYMKMTKFEY